MFSENEQYYGYLQNLLPNFVRTAGVRKIKKKMRKCCKNSLKFPKPNELFINKVFKYFFFHVDVPPGRGGRRAQDRGVVAVLLRDGQRGDPAGRRRRRRARRHDASREDPPVLLRPMFLLTPSSNGFSSNF